MQPANSDAYASSDDAEPSPVSACAALHEEAFWRGQFRSEHYYRPGLDFEDYAPAYCVGFVGSAQYGGDFADAQLSLFANWERIKCGSRLSLEEALPAMKPVEAAGPVAERTGTRSGGR